MATFAPFDDPQRVNRGGVFAALEFAGLQGIGRSACACSLLKRLVDELPDTVYAAGAAAKYPLLGLMKTADLTWKRAVRHQQRLLARAVDEPLWSTIDLSDCRCFISMEFRGQSQVAEGTVLPAAPFPDENEEEDEYNGVAFPVNLEDLAEPRLVNFNAGWAIPGQHIAWGKYVGRCDDFKATIILTAPDGRAVRLGGWRTVELPSNLVGGPPVVCFVADSLEMGPGQNRSRSPFGILKDNGSRFLLCTALHHESGGETGTEVVEKIPEWPEEWLRDRGVNP